MIVNAVVDGAEASVIYSAIVFKKSLKDGFKSD